MSTELRPILTPNTPIGTAIVENYKRVWSYDWVFATAWEKIILALAVLWSGYSLVSFLWHLVIK